MGEQSVGEPQLTPDPQPGPELAELRRVSAELAARIEQIVEGAQTLEVDLELLALDVEQGSETSRVLADTAEDVARATARALDFAERSRANVDGMVELIGRFEEQAAGIGDLLERIRGIASRSDLLALNGSLEATRAGEAGRGFALVAAEMRRLAEGVTATVTDVGARMAEIEAAGTSAVGATVESRALAEDMAAAAREIAKLTEAQSHGTRKAAATAETVARFVVTATEGSTQTQATAAQILAALAELEALLEPERDRS